jgi:hypothetical protein
MIDEVEYTVRTATGWKDEPRTKYKASFGENIHEFLMLAAAETWIERKTALQKLAKWPQIELTGYNYFWVRDYKKLEQLRETIGRADGSLVPKEKSTSFPLLVYHYCDIYHDGPDVCEFHFINTEDLLGQLHEFYNMEEA